MNNAKYFKELDYARFDFYFRSELSDYVEARKEIYVVQHAAMIIYRRPLNFLMPFISIYVKPIYQVVSPCPGTKTHFFVFWVSEMIA